jgi:hypothetical protein
MPFSYEQIEDEVIARLQATLDPYAVSIVLPDTQSQVDSSRKASETANKALVVVYYEGSDFSPSSTTNQARQNDTMNIVCNVRASKRRGVNGTMNAIQLIKISLQGFILTNATRLFLKEIKLDEHDIENQIFSYNVSFTCAKLQVQAFLDGDDAVTDPLLQQVTWQEHQFNNQDVTLGDFSANDFSSDFNIGIAI